MRYSVFLGAPPASDAPNGEAAYRWRTVTSADPSVIPDLGPANASGELFPVYPSSALDAASRRISAAYENIIFNDSHEDEETQILDEADLTRAHDRQQGSSADQTTFITWAATTQPDGPGGFVSRPPLHASVSRISSMQNLETQDFSTGSYSDTSSIARFPEFQFSPNALSALASARGKACLLLAVLEVDGPDEVTVRRGPDSGRTVSVLRLILGDESSTICKLTAWRDVAETWGGATQAPGIRRGDVVYFENVLIVTEAGGPAALTASPNLRSRAEICYRTMPRTSVPADVRLRPDLRLGASDAAVRRVAAVVAWFERMAGLGAPGGGGRT
ncbi:hypothetical protein BC834DRAFT_830447 [Gloeopeniophorella convolvens]|nr:hypothetical protein BC834DRAFT_830447 [Gloeopeniophorella convolvens]